MTARIGVAIALVFLIFISGVSWVAFHYYGKSVSDEKELTQVKDNLAAAQFLVTSQASAAVAINKVAGDSINEQSSNKQEVVKTQVVIQKVLVTAPCAAVVVPAAASDSVLDKFREVSAGSASSNSSKPVSAVPAVTTTK